MADNYDGPKVLYWCPTCQKYVRRNDLSKQRYGKACPVCQTKVEEKYNHGRLLYSELRGLVVDV